MKTLNFKMILAAVFMMGTLISFAQQPELQYFRSVDKDGLNVFETSKENDVEFTGVKVRVGGDFALQFQGLSQTNSGDSLNELANNFNLPTANLNIDVQLADGLRMHLRTYLSSRHHTESYVKGGYIQMDKLDFIKPGFMSGFMDIATIRVGMDEYNYGDTRFRRSDNARSLYNPFVGNYIMDAFSTEPFAEVTIQNNGLLAVVGLTNGRLNQSPTPGDDGYVFFGKVGYDKQMNEDLRLRLTGSWYSSSSKSTRDYIYGGDRAGGRYYQLFGTTQGTSSSDFSPRYNPRYGYLTAFQVNPFVKFKGFEFFGVFEVMNNGDDAVGGGYTQLGAEALYRFGGEENLYLAGRFNSISGKDRDGRGTKEISRLNVGGGWFMTKNVVTKLEYVTQTFSGAGWDGGLYQGAEFNGIVIEAAISF